MPAAAQLKLSPPLVDVDAAMEEGLSLSHERHLDLETGLEIMHVPHFHSPSVAVGTEIPAADQLNAFDTGFDGGEVVLDQSHL